MGQKKLDAKVVLSGEVDGSIGNIQGALGKIGNWLDSTGSKVAQAGTAVSMISVPLIAAGKQVDKLFTEFDDAKLWVKAIGDYSNAQMQEIEAVTREYGKTTRFTATEAMTAYGLLEQAGYKMSESFALLPTLLNTSSAGQIELAETTDLLVSNLKATGTPIEEAAAYVDMVGMVANKTNSDIDSLMDGMQTLGATSRMFAGDNQEVLVWLGMLQDLGYSGSESGMHLRNSMLTLAAPTAKAADAMEALGATEEEMAEAMESAANSQAMLELGARGFQVYDEATEQMRPFVDILRDLDNITSGMSEKDRNEIMSAIFPKRTLAAAGGIMGLTEEAEELLEDLEGAEGTIDRMAETREEGISGQKQRAKSAVEDAMLSIGEPLSDTIGDAADWIRDIALSTTEMDKESLARTTDLLTGIAVSGPATLLLGKGMSGLGKILKYATSPAGWITLGVLGVANLAFVLNKANERAKERDLAEHFGDLTLNTASFTQSLGTLDTGIGDALNKTDEYSMALENARNDYASLNSQFSGMMLEAITFDIEPNEVDKRKFQQLGADMHSAVLEGIAASKDESLSVYENVYGKDSNEYNALAASLDAYSSGAMNRANEIGASIQKELTSSFENGMTDETRANIRAYFDEYNALLAEIAGEDRAGDIFSSLTRLGRLSGEAFNQELEAFNALITGDKDAWMEDSYTEAKKMQEQGKSKAEIDKFLDDSEAKIDYLQIPHYDRLAWTANELGEAYSDEIGLLSGTMKNSLSQFGSAYLFANEAMGPSQNPYSSYFQEANRDSAGNEILTRTEEDNILAGVEEIKKILPTEKLMDFMKSYQERGETPPSQWQETYDLYLAAAAVETKRMQDTGSFDASYNQLLNSNGQAYDFGQQPEIQPAFSPAPGEAASEYDTAISSVSPTINVNADTSNASAEIDALSSKSVSINVIGKVTLSGLPRSVSMGVSGGGGVAKMAAYAEGGRATEASIFGEAGTEWAIPEERTPRTAQLLAQATAASGFTPQDIASYGGGLSSESAYSGATITVSPTFYVGNQATADDVLAKLQEVVENALEKADREARYAYAQ